MANYEITEKNKITVGTQTREGSGQTIKPGLRADVMRKAMETKNTLKNKGSIYMGTGNKEIIKNTLVGSTEEVEVYETKALEPDATGKVLTSNGIGSELSYEFLSDAMINTDGKNSKVFEKVASGGGISLQKDATNNYTELNFTAPNADSGFIPTTISINRHNAQSGQSGTSGAVTNYYFYSGNNKLGNIHGNLVGDISLDNGQYIQAANLSILSLKPPAIGDYSSIWRHTGLDTDSLRVQINNMFNIGKSFIPCFRKSDTSNYARYSNTGMYRVGLVKNNSSSGMGYLKAIAFKRNSYDRVYNIDHPFPNTASGGHTNSLQITIPTDSVGADRWLFLDGLSHGIPSHPYENVLSFGYDTVFIPEIISFSGKTQPTSSDDQTLYLVIFISTREKDPEGVGVNADITTFAIAKKLGSTVPALTSENKHLYSLEVRVTTDYTPRDALVYNMWSFRTWVHKGDSLYNSEYRIIENQEVYHGTVDITERLFDYRSSLSSTDACACHGCYLRITVATITKGKTAPMAPPSSIIIDMDEFYRLDSTPRSLTNAYSRRFPQVKLSSTSSTDAYENCDVVEYIDENGIRRIVFSNDVNNYKLLNVSLIEK